MQCRQVLAPSMPAVDDDLAEPPAMVAGSTAGVPETREHRFPHCRSREHTGMRQSCEPSLAAAHRTGNEAIRSQVIEGLLAENRSGHGDMPAAAELSGGPCCRVANTGPESPVSLVQQILRPSKQPLAFSENSIAAHDFSHCRAPIT